MRPSRERAFSTYMDRSRAFVSITPPYLDLSLDIFYLWTDMLSRFFTKLLKQAELLPNISNSLLKARLPLLIKTPLPEHQKNRLNRYFYRFKVFPLSCF